MSVGRAVATYRAMSVHAFKAVRSKITNGRSQAHSCQIDQMLRLHLHRLTMDIGNLAGGAARFDLNLGRFSADHFVAFRSATASPRVIETEPAGW